MSSTCQTPSSVHVLPSTAPTCAPIPDTACDVPLPQLDPGETKSASNVDSDVAFRHAWWAADRRRVTSVLESIFPDSLRLARFRECGDAAWVFRCTGDPVRYKVCSETCRDRWCRPCQRDRARIIVGNLRSHLKGETTRMVTLTLRHRSQSLRPMIDRLLQAFRTLRARRFWNDSITGGVAFIEIKWNPDTRQWHPHVHAICSGSYLCLKTLKDVWYSITGDSFVCDVRLIRDLDELAKYVVKYATKPLDTALYRDPRRLHEAIHALQGRHLALTFGTYRGWRLTAPGDGDDWVMVASLASLRRSGANGDVAAQSIIDSLTTDSTPPEKDRKPP